MQRGELPESVRYADGHTEPFEPERITRSLFAAAEQLSQAVPRQVALGIYIDDPAKCGEWAARRFALQCVSFDGRMLANAARAVVTQAGMPSTLQRSSPPLAACLGWPACAKDGTHGYDIDADLHDRTARRRHLD